MKKRLLCLLLAFTLPFGLTACGDEPDADAATAQTAPEPTPEPPQPDPAEVYADSLTLEQQVAQLFFARCPDINAVELAGQYDIGRLYPVRPRL